MNNKLSFVYLLFIIAPLFFAFRLPVGVDNEINAPASFVPSKPTEHEKYVIDKKESAVTWKGSMAFGTKHEHTGYVYASKGELMIEKGKLVGGSVEIDMNTMEYSDKQHTNSPIMHLKSSDFFDVEKFPTAAFAITRVSGISNDNVTITGNLTVKGITHAVMFPAIVELKGGVVNAVGRVVIDRTKWGIRYKSGKFYDNLADETISDDIELHMKVVARK
jgi:polyisoprenoid-binding protein YceI